MTRGRLPNHRFRALGGSILLSLCLAGASLPALAADPESPKSPEALAREGAQSLLRALEGLLLLIPQYEMPEMNENGDIVIRRKRPGDDPSAEPRRGDPLPGRRPPRERPAPDRPVPDRPAPDRPLGGPEVEETEI